MTNKPADNRPTLLIVRPEPLPWCSSGGRHEAQHDVRLAFREFELPLSDVNEEALFMLRDAVYRLEEAHDEDNDSVRSQMIAYAVQVIAAAARLPLEERLAELEARLAKLEARP